MTGHPSLVITTSRYLPRIVKFLPPTIQLFLSGSAEALIPSCFVISLLKKADIDKVWHLVSFFVQLQCILVVLLLVERTVLLPQINRHTTVFFFSDIALNIAMPCALVRFTHFCVLDEWLYHCFHFLNSQKNKRLHCCRK